MIKKKKLIAETYDVTAIMAGELNGSNTRVTDIFPLVSFDRCSIHLLNLVLHANVEECTIFFQSQSGLSAFFQNSLKEQR